MRSLIFFIPILSMAAIVPADISGVQPGPITVSASAETLTVRWPDEASRMWTAEFSLNSEKPLITQDRIGYNRQSSATPTRNIGPRQGNAAAAPASTSSSIFLAVIPREPGGSRARSGRSAPRPGASGTAIEVLFQGLKLGIFEGGIAYTFYPGSRLIYQEAVVSTQEPNTAYLYDTGLRFAAPASGVRPGRREVVSPVTYYDTEGKLHTEMTTGPDRRPAYVRYRAVAATIGRRQPGGISATAYLYRASRLHHQHGIRLVSRLGR